MRNDLNPDDLSDAEMAEDMLRNTSLERPFIAADFYDYFVFTVPSLMAVGAKRYGGVLFTSAGEKVDRFVRPNGGEAYVGYKPGIETEKAMWVRSVMTKVLDEHPGDKAAASIMVMLDEAEKSCRSPQEDPVAAKNRGCAWSALLLGLAFLPLLLGFRS